MNNERRLEFLQSSHRELDEKISKVESAMPWDHDYIKRLKKDKLRLKDKIAHLIKQIGEG